MMIIFIITVIIFIINITATVVSYNKKAKDPFWIRYTHPDILLLQCYHVVLPHGIIFMTSLVVAATRHYARQDINIHLYINIG